MSIRPRVPRTTADRRRAHLAAMTAAVTVSVLLLPAALAPAGEPPARSATPRDAVPSLLPAPGRRPYLGVVAARSSGALRVVRVIPGSPAARSGIEVGDVLTRLDSHTLNDAADLGAALDTRVPGDAVVLRTRTDDGERRLRISLGDRKVPDVVWDRPGFRLAVVPIRFPGEEQAHAGRAELTRRFFADRTRRGADASLAAYFDDQSFGTLRVTGDVMPPVTAPRPRSHYADQWMGGRRGSLYQDVTDCLVDRAELDGCDGVAFVLSGPAETRTGRALWPHRSDVVLGGRRMPYMVHDHAPGSTDLGGPCHEFGHLLGLDDEYGVGHRTGSGDFCLMAIGHRGGGETGARSPFSLCAPCRMRLGWLRPTVVDPRTPQRLRLPPVGDDPRNVFVVPLERRTREYLVLETRRRTGFDRELPSEGLLVWHVGGPGTPGQGPYRGEVDLIEAHGIDTFDAALVRPDRVAFPTSRAVDLTPVTRPALPSRPDRFPVHLTGIRRHGRDRDVTFTLGVPRMVVQDAPFPYVPTAPERDGAVVRPDPLTGELVRFYPERLRIPGLPGREARGASGER